jgi:hypothetical protein
MLLDQDLRSTTAYLATLTQWGFRDKFSHLNQLCQLLNLETIDEVHEYISVHSRHAHWKWTVSDIKKVLSSR